MVCLLPSSGLLYGGRGRGEGWGRSGGQLKQRCLPAANSSDAKENRQGRCTRAESPDVLPLPTVDLSLAGRAWSSLPELLMGHCAVPGGTKLDSSVGGQSPKKKLTKCGIYSKVCGLKVEPLRTGTSNLKTVFVTFANTYFPPKCWEA